MNNVALVMQAVEAVGTDSFAGTFARLCAQLDRMAAEERAYWASPEGRAVSAAKRAAREAAAAAAAAALQGKLAALRAEVADLLAERATLRAQLEALPRTARAERAELATEINEVGYALGKANAAAHALES